MAKNKEIFHDEVTAEVYSIQNLNSETFDPFEVLKENKILDSSEDSLRRSDAILRKCLDI